MSLTLSTLLIPGIAISPQISNTNYKISDSKEISAEKLIESFGNKQMFVKYNGKDYSFATVDFLNYFLNKSVSEVIGEEDYNSFLSTSPSKPEGCKCSLNYEWIDGKKVSMGVDNYSIGLVKLVTNSPLNKMLNEIPILYNSGQLEELSGDTTNLIGNFEKSKLLMTLADFISPEEFRTQKNKGSTCYILVDAYERILLNRFVEKGMKNFLEQLPEPKKK